MTGGGACSGLITVADGAVSRTMIGCSRTVSVCDVQQPLPKHTAVVAAIPNLVKMYLCVMVSSVVLFNRCLFHTATNSILMQWVTQSDDKRIGGSGKLVVTLRRCSICWALDSTMTQSVFEN